MKSELGEMLRINESQKKYYEHANGTVEAEVNGTATNLWRRWRGRALSVFADANMLNTLKELHLQWLNNDVSQCKILDLGVGDGNPLSVKFAQEAKEYIAIDLSSAMVEQFQKKLERAGATTARAYVADVLSDEFTEGDFDIVYARAVFHHFKYFDVFLEKVHRRLAPRGVVLTMDDPLETWFPIKLLRLLYRPFQTDASWEYPFTNESLRAIQHHFTVEQVQGSFGKSKWAIPLGFLLPEFARRRAKAWHEADLDRAFDMKNVRSCLRVSLLLRKEEQ